MLITALWPKLYSGTAAFRLGFSDKPTSHIYWSDWEISEDTSRLDFFLSGIYLHFELQTIGTDFLFNGYMLEAMPTGSLS
jgi:hypothetical protein